MSGKRKSLLLPRSVEDDSLTAEEEQGEVVVIAPYDNVSSPDSTASGPVYAPRQPGFLLHAHHKKKSPQELKQINNNKKIQETQQLLLKPRPKREPLPMKLRALPQSFWQQPNQPTSVAPGVLFPVLPPLTMSREGAGGNQRGTEEGPEETAHESLLVSPANTELLFSLFHCVEEDDSASRPPVVRRGRPRKAPSQLMSRVLRDDDPCLGSAAGHAALPVLMPPRNLAAEAAATPGGRQQQTSHQQLMAMLPLRDYERTSLSLPSLSGVDNSYSQLLSELVVRL